MITLKNFSIFRSDAPIITQVSFTFKPSCTVVIQGDNGAGKSTFVAGLMGLSGYTTAGVFQLHGQDITEWPLEKRAQAGIFLSYQYPLEIPGLAVKTFLHHAYRACHGPQVPLAEIDTKIVDAFAAVGLPADCIERNVHEGFSGGQKKRFELAQMLVLEPAIIMLDELDSGLDSAGRQMLIEVVHAYKKKKPESLFIIITHNPALAEHLQADIHLTMQAGRLVTA